MRFFTGVLPKICPTYPTMMKFGTVISYLRKTQKIYESRDKLLSSAVICIFSPEISKFFYIQKFRYNRLYFDAKFLIPLTFSKFLNTVLINMVIILMMSAKMDTLGLLKVKVFSNKCYDVVSHVDYVTKTNFIKWLKLY